MQPANNEFYHLTVQKHTWTTVFVTGGVDGITGCNMPVFIFKGVMA